VTANPPSRRSALRVYRRLLGYAAPYWRAFLISVLGMIIYAATEPALASLMKPLLDGSFVERDPEVVRALPLYMLGLFLVRGTASFVNTYFMKWVGRMVVANLRAEMFGHLLRLPVSYYDHHSAGILISKLTYNVEQVAGAATQAVTYIIREGLTVTFLLGYLLYLNARLAMILVVIGPLLAITVRYVTKRFRRVSKRIQDAVGQITHVAQEAINANRVVKSFGGIAHEERRFGHANEHNARLQMKMVVTDSVSVPVVQLIAAGGIAGIVYLSTLEALRSSVTPGGFMAFVVAMGLMLSPIKRLTSVNVYLQKGITAAISIFELLDAEAERDTGTGELDRARGLIELRGVGHTYMEDKGPVLRDVDLTIEPGQTVAFVGRSGSGKTTLVSLMSRFYDATQGQVLIDGNDIRDLTLQSLRRQIAMVGQEVTLFNDTIANNIAYGELEKASPEALAQVARAAHAAEFIDKLPQGMDTLIGDRGVLLSGGQRQRLAIARAMLKDAPILILDEATSSLDSESERHIQLALEELIEHRTTLVIAHRLSTIENADLIVVMDEGRIVEQGRHEELIALNGRYAELHRLQFRDEQPG
jgi:subfamily B ATP-binding cassette protein MsbA